MLEGIYQTITMGLAFAAFYGLDFSLIAFYAKQRKKSSWDIGYTLTGIGVAIGLSLQPMILPMLGLHITATWGLWLQGLGLVLLLGSLILQIWARIHLGRFYAEGADVQPGHYVIDTGPYSYVRHPLFVSYMIFTLGIMCVTPATTTLAVVIYTCWDFSRAAEADERLLTQQVQGYADYMKRVPRFIPRLWNRLAR